MKTYDQVIAENKPSLVVFTHSNEKDEAEINRLTDALKKQYGDTVNLLRVDASYNHRVTRNLRLAKTPTWILFKKGEELMRESGMKSESELMRLIERAN